MLTRRNFIRSSAAIGLVGTLSTTEIAAQTPTTSQEYEPVAKIGDTREEFDSEYGAGREEGGWVIYGEDDPSTAFYHVLFNSEGIAETIESVYSHLADGGLPIDGDIGLSRFVPNDAEGGAGNGNLGGYRATEPRYSVRRWNSPELANATGRSGNVIVIDAISFFGPDLGEQYTHTMVSMETFEVHELVPNGEFMGPHNSVEEWEEYSGESDGMFGLTFSNGPVPGLWTVVDDSVSVEPDPALGTVEAHDLLATMVQPGEILWTTFIPPSPLGAEGVRLHGSMSDFGETVTAQWVLDGEEAGSVSKIMTGFTQFPEPRS